MEITEKFLYHGSLADITDGFLNPTRGGLYEDAAGNKQYETYLTSHASVAIGHLTSRLGRAAPIRIADTYIFDRADAPAFGYLYTTEIPDDLEHYALSAISSRPVRILEKYALTPTTLAKFWPHAVRVMRPRKWRHLSAAQLADRLDRVVQRTRSQEARDQKIQKLLDKYTYTI